MTREFTGAEIERTIGMAWQNRTNFDVIKDQFGRNESEVIKIMRQKMKRGSFKICRECFSGRKTKHHVLTEKEMDRFVSPNQSHQDRSF